MTANRWFSTVRLKMKPSANSTYDLKDATASFFILVKNTDGGFLISSFATGI